MALLKEAAEVLIDIHGQHEHQSLLYKKNHLGIVDAFAKSQVSELKEEVFGLYKSYRNACKELEEADMMKRAEQKSFLLYALRYRRLRMRRFVKAKTKNWSLPIVLW